MKTIGNIFKGVRSIKKLLCVALAAIVFRSSCCTEVNALFGNTHFNLGKRMIEKFDTPLLESEKSAFLSGLVYADIGRFKFDKETGIYSDSDNFANEMKKFAVTPEEHWFARGFEAHVMQDNETGNFLTDVLGRKSSAYAEYIMDCSLLDSYFSKKNGVLYNNFLDKFSFEQITMELDVKDIVKAVNISEDKIKDFTRIILNKYSSCENKNTLILYDDLIKKTYHSFGFEIGLDDIHQQAANLIGAFIVTSIVAGQKEIPEELVSRIEGKSDELAKFCITNFNLN